jgi:aryl-alcohol dehydrogenase-like predicted oxidoreductase
MELRLLGSSGLRVSRLCLGTMTFGQSGWGCDENEAEKIVGSFLDAGGNFFDSADSYAGGRSEEILGRLIASRRSEVVVATKVGNRTGGSPSGRGHSRSHIINALHASLRRLGTDYVDLYQLHYYDNETPIEETLRALEDCVRAGYVRYIGCSNLFGWQLGYANTLAHELGTPKFASCQMMYNLVRRDLEREHFAACEALGVGLLTYSPLHSGVLAQGLTSDLEPPAGSRVGAHPRIREVYFGDEARVDQVVEGLLTVASEARLPPRVLALGWVLHRPEITSVLTGAQSAHELAENIACLDLAVDGEVWNELDRATALPPSYPSDFYRRLPWTLRLVED